MTQKGNNTLVSTRILGTTRDRSIRKISRVDDLRDAAPPGAATLPPLLKLQDIRESDDPMPTQLRDPSDRSPNRVRQLTLMGTGLDPRCRSQHARTHHDGLPLTIRNSRNSRERHSSTPTARSAAP